MAVQVVTVALLLLLTDGSSAAIRTKVNDIFTRCFDIPVNGQDPTRPECTKAFTQYAVDMKTKFNFTEEEINYMWSLDREVQGNFRRRSRREALRLRQECRLMGEIQRHRLFKAINIIKRHTVHPVMNLSCFFCSF